MFVKALTIIVVDNKNLDFAYPPTHFANRSLIWPPFIVYAASLGLTLPSGSKVGNKRLDDWFGDGHGL